MLKNLLKNIVSYSILIVDYLIPKNKNMIVFFQSNNKYDDNSKYLFEYFINYTHYEVYWLCEKSIKNKSNFIKRYSIKGLLIFLRAKFSIISHGSGDFGLYLKNNKFIIQVWHGIPIKNLGIYDYKFKKQDFLKIKQETKNYDLFIVSSEIEKYYISSAMLLDKENILVSGLPRHDYLLDNKNNFNNKRMNKFENRKIILYAPTFRDFGKMIFFPFQDFNINILKKSLIEQNAILLVRPHPNDKDSITLIHQLEIESENKICLFDNKVCVDINEVLPFVDVIVTDYSSIYIDLLLKDIPSVFLPYDLEKYKKERGLAYNYELVTPGPKVFTQKDFLIAIKEALNGASDYSEQRVFVKKMFHKYEDAHACKRIVKRLEDFL